MSMTQRGALVGPLLIVLGAGCGGSRLPVETGGSAARPEASGEAGAGASQLEGEGEVEVVRRGWVRSFGGIGDDELRRMAVGADGSIYLAGHFQETADLDPGEGVDARMCAGGIDIFLVKLTADGVFLWGHSFGGPGMDYGLGLSVAEDGSVYLSGAFEETIDVDPGPGVDNRQSAGAADALVARFDADGGLLWARTYGGANNDYATAVAQVPGGGVVVGGSFEDGTDLDPGQGVDRAPNAGDLDLYVMALDGAGDRRWARTLGGAGMDIVETVGLSGDEVIAIGAFSDTVDVDPGPGLDQRTAAGQGDALILRLGPTGDVLWARGLGGAGEDIAGGLAVRPDGSIVVAGQFEGSIDVDPGPGRSQMLAKSSVDMFVLALDRRGGFLWGGAFGTQTADSSGTSISSTSAGTLLVAGNGGVPLVHLSAAGGYLGSVELPEGVVVDGWGVHARDDGSAIWAGSFRGVAATGVTPLPEPVTSAGEHDVFISRIEAIPGR